MAEFVEAVGRYIVDAQAGTVKTVMRFTDAEGWVSEKLTHCCTISTFKAWCAAMREAEAEIDAHLGRQNVVSLSSVRRHADTA